MPNPSGTTTELYRTCMILSEEARSLLVRNEGMNRLGLNAQVQAAQTGKQGAGLEVIVSEIGRLSKAIREVLEALGGAAKSLSQSSIEVLHLANLDTSYEKGLARGIDPRSQEIFNKTHSAIRSRGKRHLADLDARLRAVSSLVENLGRIAQRILPVTTMIQIVVTEVEMDTTELLSTVDGLKTFHRDLDAKVEHMKNIHDACSLYIRKLEKESR